MCVTSVADADFPRFDRVPPARPAPGAIFGYAAMEQTESPPVEGDVAPVEAAVEAEAVPGEAPEPAPAPANPGPAPAAPADDAAEGEAGDEPKEEGARAHDDGDDGPSAGAGDDDGEEPAGDDDGGAGDAEDEPLEPDADAPNADESEWDTLTRLGLFTRGAPSSSAGSSVDALVDELVDQSMNTDGSDLDLGPDGPDDIHDAPAPGTDTARPDASSPRDDRPPDDHHLMDELEALETSRRELAGRNAELERALAAHLSRAKTRYSDGADVGGGDAAMDDADDPEAARRRIRYRNALAGWRRAREATALAADEHAIKCAEVRADLDARSAKRDATVAAFETYRAEVAKAAEYPGNPGKGLSDDAVESRLRKERAADAVVTRERVTNARLRRRLARTEEKVRDKEELAAGLFLVDFEQLKIENGALREKIDARNDDLVRLRAKTGSQVQTLTHMKEKLQHVKKENERMVRELATLAEESDKKGDHMRRLKAERDRYKKENERMQAASNTVDAPVLLDDYRYLKQKSTHLRQKVARLQRMCAEAQAIKTSRTPRSGTKSKTPAATPKPDATPAGNVGF